MKIIFLGKTGRTLILKFYKPFGSLNPSDCRPESKLLPSYRHSHFTYSILMSRELCSTELHPFFGPRATLQPSSIIFYCPRALAPPSPYPILLPESTRSTEPLSHSIAREHPLHRALISSLPLLRSHPCARGPSDAH